MLYVMEAVEFPSYLHNPLHGGKLIITQAVALVGAGILLLSHFPPPNSKLIIDDDIDKPHDGETEPVPA